MGYVLVRIGTWNLQGLWSSELLSLLQAQTCDVLQLTEVNERLSMPGHHLYLPTALMAARRGREVGAFAARDSPLGR